MHACNIRNECVLVSSSVVSVRGVAVIAGSGWTVSKVTQVSSKCNIFLLGDGITTTT